MLPTSMNFNLPPNFPSATTANLSAPNHEAKGLNTFSSCGDVNSVPFRYAIDDDLFPFQEIGHLVSPVWQIPVQPRFFGRLLSDRTVFDGHDDPIDIRRSGDSATRPREKHKPFLAKTP